MSITHICVFPTQKQIEYMLNEISPIENLILVIQDDSKTDREVFTKNGCSFRIYGKIIPEKILSSLKENSARVMCCHEEAIYWVRIYGSRKWVYQFGPKYLDVLSKKCFKEFLSQVGIKNSSFYVNSELIPGFPVIAKPSIGFGSIGVKRLANQAEALQYISHYDEMCSQSAINKYKNLYFPHDPNPILFEEIIVGDFYRTPFIVYNHSCVAIFPIRGVRNQNEIYSDFHWVDFEYSENERKVAEDVKPLLEEIRKNFMLEDGVYVAEFIQTSDKEIYLLEFSPRQTSSRIAKIVNLATGIDLERIGIDLFFKRRNIVLNQIEDKQIKLVMGCNNEVFPPNGYNVLCHEPSNDIHGNTVEEYFLEKKNCLLSE